MNRARAAIPRGRAAGPEDAFARTAEFLRNGLELIVDSVREIDAGAVVLTPSLPQVWNLNQIRLLQPTPWTTALQRAEEHLMGLPYRHVIADTDAIGTELAEPLGREGFTSEREVVMAMAGSPPAEPQGPPVIKADDQAMTRLERRWLEEDRRVSEEALEQLLEAGRRERLAWDERRFAVAGAGGELAAMTKLRSDGRTAQVEDVYTAPEARGRGFARALVTHAVTLARQSGHELVFIIADDDDWPKHLYTRLGFRPVGRRWAFHKELG